VAVARCGGGISRTTDTDRTDPIGAADRHVPAVAVPQARRVSLTGQSLACIHGLCHRRSREGWTLGERPAGVIGAGVTGVVGSASPVTGR